MRVWNTSTGTLGMLNQAKVIDAHSQSAGNMTVGRNVNGSTLYFTDAGARAFDQMQADAQTLGREIRSERDPGAIKKFFLGDMLGSKEQHRGTVP